MIGQFDMNEWGGLTTFASSPEATAQRVELHVLKPSSRLAAEMRTSETWTTSHRHAVDLDHNAVVPLQLPAEIIEQLAHDKVARVPCSGCTINTACSHNECETAHATRHLSVTRG